MLGPHSVSVLRAGTKAADYGNGTQPDWEQVTETVVAGCSAQPLPAPENTVDRDNVSHRWLVWMPGDTDIKATDRVVYGGAEYDVDGEPDRWDFTPLSHVVVRLRRSEG